MSQSFNINIEEMKQRNQKTWGLREVPARCHWQPLLPRGPEQGQREEETQDGRGVEASGGVRGPWPITPGSSSSLTASEPPLPESPQVFPAAQAGSERPGDSQALHTSLSVGYEECPLRPALRSLGTGS